MTVSKDAKPGDTIEVTYPSAIAGNKYVVIECPGDPGKYPEGCAWHDNLNEGPSFCKKEYYKIVKRVSTPSIVSDTPVDLEKSLRQKRDEIMRGYFT